MNRTQTESRTCCASDRRVTCSRWYVELLEVVSGLSRGGFFVFI